MINLLKDLSNLSGISGDEGAVREYIISQIDGFCEYKVDQMGNILAFKKGAERPAKRVMLSAHMDEVGLMVTSVTSTGHLKFSAVGGIDPRVIYSQKVLIGKNKVVGVIADVPIHMLSAAERDKAPSIESLCIDIGAKSKQEALEYVSLGDSAVFETKFSNFGDGLLKGKALDDRAGCAVIIDILRGDVKFDLNAAFVVQEEIGLRGAKCAAYSVNPDFAVVVEATTAADISGVSEENQVCKVGGGAVISFMDSRTIYDKGMYNCAFEIAGERSIAVQAKEAVAGGNDAGAIHLTRGGVRTLAVSLPCRYLHAPCSVISEKDLQCVREITLEIAEKSASGALD